MGRPLKPKTPCLVDACPGDAVAHGLCRSCYYKKRTSDRKAGLVTRDKRSHPLYSIWWERKNRGSLCTTWAADFDIFVNAVGDRPSPSHLLRKLRAHEPYGPKNYEWMAALKKRPEETKKAFYARKWASRKERFPDFDGDRNLLRKYGVTPKGFTNMLDAQEYICRICSRPESRLHHKTSAPQKLAVDHCGKTGKVRGLLCWNCNTTLGKVDHSPARLQKMIEYLNDHGAWLEDVDIAAR